VPLCPNIATNVCAGAAGNCPGVTDLAACHFRRTLQAFEAETPDRQQASRGITPETNPHGFRQYTDGTTGYVDPAPGATGTGGTP